MKLAKVQFKRLGVLSACVLFFITHFGLAGEDLDHKSPTPAKISLILGSGDSEWVVAALFSYWTKQGGGPFPSLVAMEPGPIDLDSGLRVLANEVAPRFSQPDLLLVSTLGAVKVDHVLLALVRRCTQQGVPVWVIGPMPEEWQSNFRNDPLFQRMEPAQLEERLLSWCAAR